MPTIDDLLKSSESTESKKICSTQTPSTSNEENIMTRFHHLLNELKSAFESATEHKNYTGIKTAQAECEPDDSPQECKKKS